MRIDYRPRRWNRQVRAIENNKYAIWVTAHQAAGSQTIVTVPSIIHKNMPAETKTNGSLFRRVVADTSPGSCHDRGRGCTIHNICAGIPDAAPSLPRSYRIPLDPLTYLLRYARCLRVGPWDCVPGLGYICGVRLFVTGLWISGGFMQVILETGGFHCVIRHYLIRCLVSWSTSECGSASPRTVADNTIRPKYVIQRYYPYTYVYECVTVRPVTSLWYLLPTHLCVWGLRQPSAGLRVRVRVRVGGKVLTGEGRSSGEEGRGNLVEPPLTGKGTERSPTLRENTESSFDRDFGVSVSAFPHLKPTATPRVGGEGGGHPRGNERRESVAILVLCRV